MPTWFFGEFAPFRPAGGRSHAPLRGDELKAKRAARKAERKARARGRR